MESVSFGIEDFVPLEIFAGPNMKKYPTANMTSVVEIRIVVSFTRKEDQTIQQLPRLLFYPKTAEHTSDSGQKSFHR